MILSFFSRKNSSQNKAVKSTAPFSHLSKSQQEEILKNGAKEFSRKFTQTIVKLSNE